MHLAKAIGAVALCFFAGEASAATPVDASQCAAMKAHHVLNAGAPVGCERLAVVRFSYGDFSGRSHDDGVIVVMDVLAPHVEQILATLYALRFPIAKSVPLEVYEGDDNAAMADNNTSSFNHRVVAGSARLSLHAYGAAIDIDPVQNPFITNAGQAVAPVAASAFLDRSTGRQGMVEKVVEVFADNGFLNWGGDWHDPIDYQHFDVGRVMAEKLAALPPDQGRVVFEAAINAYQHCIGANMDKLPGERRQICAEQGLK